MNDEDLERAKNACLRLLTYRARTRAELKKRLFEKGFAADVSDEALKVLEKLGLVDDEEFARAWVASRIKLRPMGAKALMWELRRHGVSEKIASAAISEAVEDGQEYNLALELARTRLRRKSELIDMTNPPPREVLLKLSRFLAGRGFSYEVIKQVINTLNGQGTEDES